MTFDMGRAWNEGIAKVSANFSLLAILGGVFFFVPSVLIFIAVPDLMGAMMMNPDMAPDDMANMFANIGPTFFGLYFLIMLASLIGYGAMIALVGDGRRVSVGEAIGAGIKALLPLLAILVIFIVVYFVAALVIGLIFGLLIGLIGQASTAIAGILTFIFVIGLMLAVLWVLTRFSLTMPVLVIDGTMNPFAALGRSWSLTKPVQGRLFLFYVLLFVAYLVIALVFFMVMGLIVAGLGAPSAIGFLNGIIGALVAMVFSGVLAAIYGQLAGSTPQALGDTFE